MKIKGENLNDKLVMEIGKFAILWNCFERDYCNNYCKVSEIKKAATLVSIDNEKQAKLSKVLNQRRGSFGLDISEYIETRLHPRNARHNSTENKQFMRMFLEQQDEDLRFGCLLVIFRIRNNLMHGLKCIEQLNDQLELFRAVNDVLESIIRITAQKPEKCKPQSQGFSLCDKEATIPVHVQNSLQMRAKTIRLTITI